MISMQQIHGPKFFQMLGNRNYDLAPGNMFNGNRHMFELNDNQFVQNNLHSAIIDSKCQELIGWTPSTVPLKPCYYIGLI